MFRSGKWFWLLLPLFAVFFSVAAVRSQQNAAQQPLRRPEDTKPYQRQQWAYNQRAYPAREIPDGALPRAERQLQQWKSRFQKQAQQAATGRWANLGPAPINGGQTALPGQTRPVSGRVTDIAVDPSNASRWLIGGAQGGIWETRDAGNTWTPLTDDQASLAIGAIAFAPGNPRIIYAGTGEAPLGGGPYAGMGLLKSTDGGRTWQLLAQTAFAGNSFSDIKVDPKNPQILVAALVRGPNSFGATRPPGTVPAAGVFKSTDGGVNWNSTLSMNSFATDLETDPSDFNRQYAALGLQDGSANNSVYRSLNAGDTWTRIDGPWTTRAGGAGRVELAIAPANPGILYVSIQDANDGTASDNQLLGIWRTDDAWATPLVWRELALNAALRAEAQWNYDHEIIVDVTRPETLYVGGVHLWKSPDTTASPIVWEQLDNKPDNALHVDQHTMAWTPAPQTTTAALDKLPMSFEPNQGQAETATLFQSHGPGYNMQLRHTEAVLQLQRAKGGGRRKKTSGAGTIAAASASAVLKMQMVGASRSPRVRGERQLPGKSNYYIGNDQRDWRTGIPQYAAVRYNEVWPGVDLAWYGNQQRLEHDFIVAPGASPRQIRLAFRSAGNARLKPRISRNGDLILRARGGHLRLLKPVIYQEHKGIRQEIRGRYVRRGNKQIGFQVAAYDRGLPLVIDPVLVYSTYLGPASPDWANDIAVDPAGNVYLTGASFFPAEGLNAYVAKLNAQGTALLWSTALIGGKDDIGFGVAIDPAGNAYVTGQTKSLNFPVRNALQPRLGGAERCGSQPNCSWDAFVTKVDSAGAIVYSTFLGGGDAGNTLSDDYGSDIAVDSSGQAYIAGLTTSTDFPVRNAYQPRGAALNDNGDIFDGFVSKISATGRELVYSTYLGGRALDSCYGIAVDAAQNVYVTGATLPLSGQENNFPTTPTAFQRTAPGGNRDGFVTKFNASGSGLVFSTFLGGGGVDQGEAIALDTSDNVYVLGYTLSNDFPLKDPLQSADPRGSVFLSKLLPGGSGLAFSTCYGKQVASRSGNFPGMALAVDAAGVAYLTGTTDAADFPTVNPVSPGFAGVRDAFVVKINTVTRAIRYATLLGGRFLDYGFGIAADAAGNAYVTGQTTSPDFPTKNPAQATLGGEADVFVAKIADQSAARLIVGNDGGVWSTADGGQTWADHNTNLSITQLYSGSLHPANANAAFGAGQDNGTAWWTGASPWPHVFSGDGSSSAFSSASPDRQWMLSAQNLFITRTMDGGATLTQVDAGIGAANRPFIAQCVKCPNNDNVFLAGTDSIWRTDNFFSSAPGLPAWTQDTPSIGGLISAIAFSPVDNACDTWAYAANNGQIRLTQDGGVTVNNIGAANLPGRYLTDLAFHPFDANILYATFSGFDEATPGQPGHLFKTTNALAPSPVWTNLSPPVNIPLNAIAVDPSNPQIIYAGADQGVWKSVNGGANWEHYGPDKGMPRITVYDLQINARTERVIAFTHGRGAFALERNRADLALTKTASPNPVIAGQDLRYTLTVKNNGPDKATEVYLRDTLPPGVTYVSSGASEGFCTGNDTSVNCQIGEINNGATVTITITVRPAQPGMITNTAQASSDENDPNPANDKATVTTEIIAPDLIIAKSHSPANVLPGQNFNYDITIRNAGKAGATGVTLTDTLPAGVAFVSATATQGSCAGSTTITCNHGNLARGAALAAQIIVRATASGSITNTATAQSVEPDGNPADNRAQDTLVISAGPALTRITPPVAAPGAGELELKIEGARFEPGAVISFLPAAGIDLAPVLAPDTGFIGPTEIRRRITVRADAAPGERQLFVTNPNGASGGERPFNVFTITGATAAIEATQASLDFGNVTTGQNRDLTLTLRNTGGAALTVNPIATGNPVFAITGPAMPFSVSPGARQDVSVRFTPARAGAQSGALTITSNAANRPRLAFPLTGAGAGAPDITAAPAVLDFGAAPPGQNVTRTLTINNPGNAALHVYAISSSHPGFRAPLPFTPLSVPAGGAIALPVSYAPTSLGEQTGTLLIASNAVNKNTLAIEARGDTPGVPLTTDDGTVETGAVQDGLLIVNRLTPPRYPATLRGLRVFMAQFQGLPSPAGEQIRLIAFADPAGTGQPPANPRLLVSQMVRIPDIPANGGFVEFPVTPATSPAGSTEAAHADIVIESGDLYVGYQAPRPTRGVVFAADANGPQQQRAFFSTDDGAGYARLTGVTNPQGVVTQVNIMTQALIGGAGVCTYAITPAVQAHGEAGGNGMVAVTAPPGCGWTAVSNVDWIRFAPPGNGNGNGVANFSVDGGSTARLGIVTVAGQTLTVAQAEKVASVSGASYRRAGLAGEAIAAAFGTALAGEFVSATSVPLPTTLSGTTVKVRDAGGTELFAPLFFVSPGQVNFLMPPGLAPGAATVTVTNAGGVAAVGAVVNDLVAPGLFAANTDGQGAPTGYAIRVKPDGAQLYEAITRYDTALGRFALAPLDLGPVGDQVILVLFGTGFRGIS
ncbi:MAG: SBBP repeat-containing protein, partial [Blastocatellia bacterium]